MDPRPVNEFLPASVGASGDDEFDVARFSAIRKEQKDELERLDRHHFNKQAAIENQIRAEYDHLFQHFQKEMQNFYTSLTQTVHSTVENQVQHRLQMERNRQDHAANKKEVEKRYHNETSRLLMSSSQPTRPAQHVPRAPSNAPRPTSGNPPTHGEQLVSPPSSSSTTTPPVRQQAIQKPLPSNAMREFIVQEPQNRDYVAPYPTPLEPPPKTRRAISDPRHGESRPIAPRQVDSPQAEPPGAPRQVESRQVKARHTEPRQVGPPQADTRQFDTRQADIHQQAPSHQAELRYVEARPTESRESRDVVSRPILPRQAESHHIGPRQAEVRPVEPRQVEPRPVEPAIVQPVAGRQLCEEPASIEPQPPLHVLPSQQTSRHTDTSDPPPFRAESKRKAADASPKDDASPMPYSKRPRTRERPVEDLKVTASSPPKQIPRSQRPSQIAVEPRIERTIAFDEVFQGGKSQYRHKIFEYKPGSGNWYIVRCDEHQVHFGISNPVHGAAKHVHSPQHGNQEKKHDLAIEICGHRVVGCNAELAEKNNREFERALKEDNYVVFNMNLLSKEDRRRLTDVTDNAAQTGGDTPIKRKSKPLVPTKRPDDLDLPQECCFYQGLWQPTKKWYMLIILPIRPGGDLREVGLKEKLQETQLMSNVPKCYRVDRISLLIKGWQPAYEDGGPKVEKREYPVMFFDGHARHSLGWLTAQKLRPVDLDDPPEQVDKRGLSIAREWYAVQMMHRKSWEDFKKLGPGETTSATASDHEMGRAEPWPSLRSANADNQSPIADKPGHSGFPSSSEDGSDEEDPMTMDIGPIPEPADSNYIGESGSEADDSDVGMREAGPRQDKNHGKEDAARPGRRTSAHTQARSKRSSQSSSQNGAVSEMSVDRNEGGPDTPATERDGAETEPAHEPPSKPNSTEAGHERGIPTELSEREDLRRRTQERALAAVHEAASRSRTSSEVPEFAPPHVSQAPSTNLSRPALAEHHRSRSDDISGGLVGAAGQPGDIPQLSALQSILNKEHGHAQRATYSETRVDPYQQFEAIKAQVATDNLKNRPTSAPVQIGPGPGTFRPPPVQSGDNVQNSPSLSHILSPPSQSPTMAPRSASTTPVQGPESGRTTPKIVIPGAGISDKWQAVRSFSSNASPPQQQKPSQNPRASFVGEPSVVPSQASSQTPNQTHNQSSNGHVEVTPKRWTPTPQLGTPIPDKLEIFEVTQFRDSARGMRWSREGPSAPSLRLVTDPMRGWAETAATSPLAAVVEPRNVSRIDLDGGDKQMQMVKLTLKDHNEQVLGFETNSSGGRSQAASLQGRRFVSWVRKMNGDAEYHSSNNSRRSSVVDERRPTSSE